MADTAELVILGNDGLQWPQTTDAKAWVTAWKVLTAKYPVTPTEDDLMLWWFAKSIRAGKDAAQRRAHG